MRTFQKVLFLMIVLLAANSQAGRWITRDPVEFMERDPKPQVNLYKFVDNNPINEVDPLGLSGTLTIDARSGGGSSALVTILSSSGGDSGHSYITYTPDGGTITSYGTYGNNPLGTGNGLFQNIELQLGYPAPNAIRSQHLNDAQEQSLFSRINQFKLQGPNAWGYRQTCTVFAHDAWQAGTGENLNTGSLNLPSTLAGSINDANWYGYTPSPIVVGVSPTLNTAVNTPTIYIQMPTTPPR